MKTIKILQRILEIPGAYNDNYLSRITSLLQILTEFSRMFHGMSLEGSSIHVVVSCILEISRNCYFHSLSIPEDTRN